MLELVQALEQIKDKAEAEYKIYKAKKEQEQAKVKKNSKYVDLSKGIDLKGFKAIASDDDAESQLKSLLDIVDQLFYDVSDYNYKGEKFMKEKCACNLYFSMRAIDTIITDFIDISNAECEDNFYRYSDYLEAWENATCDISQSSYELYESCVKLRDEITKLSNDGKFKAVDYLGFENIQAMSERLADHASRLADKASKNLGTEDSESWKYDWRTK